MIILRSLVAVLVLGLISLTIVQAQAENAEIDNVEEIRVALYGTLAGGDSERLYENDHVHADELIETVKNPAH